MSFYCQKACGEENFSIDEWNKASEMCDKMNLSDVERNKILFPEPCASQCFDCTAIVGARQIKTKAILLTT